jgi:hypothetical protein
MKIKHFSGTFVLDFSTNVISFFNRIGGSRIAEIPMDIRSQQCINQKQSSATPRTRDQFAIQSG